MDNIVIIPILLDNLNTIVNKYKDLKLLIVFSSTNSKIYKIYKNYIRRYLSCYHVVENRIIIDVFYINHLYRYKCEKDAIILRNMIKLPNVNNTINKLCIRRLKGDLYKGYLQSLSKINSYNLLKSVFDYSSKHSNIEVFNSLRLLSTSSKTHNTTIIDMVNNYVEHIIDNMIEYITNMDEDILIYNPHIYNLFVYYIFRGSKNKSLRIYKIYTNNNISRSIRKLCEYSLRYKYGSYLTRHHGIVFS